MNQYDDFQDRIDIAKKLGEISATCKAHLASDVDMRQWMKDHESRIQKLENWRWYILGACAMIGFLLAVLEVEALRK